MFTCVSLKIEIWINYDDSLCMQLFPQSVYVNYALLQRAQLLLILFL